MLDITCYILISTFVICILLGRSLKIDVTVKGPAEVTVDGGFREIVSPSDGLVTKVYKKNGDRVKPQDLIARIQMDDDASNEVQKVSNYIDDLTKKVERAPSPLDLPVPAPLVRTYKIYDATVLQALANVEHSIHDFDLQKSQALILMKTRSGNDKAASEVYYANQRIKFLTRKLNEMKASSHRDLLSTYIDATEEELGRLKTQVTTARLRANTTLDQGYADLLRNLRIARGTLDDYRLKHEVRAPVDGVVGRIIDGDSIHMTVNRSIATIIPTSAKFITSIKMKSKDIVRVKKGQKVLYKVEAYPFQRYGLFTGEVVDFEQIKDTQANPAPPQPGASAPASTDDDVFILHATIYAPTNLSPELQSRIKFIFGMRAEATVVMERKSIDEIMMEKFFNMKDL